MGRYWLFLVEEPPNESGTLKTKLGICIWNDLENEETEEREFKQIKHSNFWEISPQTG